MKILKCPHCKQLVHFDSVPNWETCWHCAVVSNFSRIENTFEKILLHCERVLNRFTSPIFDSRIFHRVAKAGVLLALPIAVAMLLFCNSLDISIVDDPLDSFASTRIPAEGGEGFYIECLTGK